MTNITDNFTLEEFSKSEIAKAKGIDNTPSLEVIIKVIRLVDNCLQKIRNHFNKPIIITSGYRCAKLNQSIGGVSSSQHCNGEAADFIVKGVSINTVIKWCRENLDFDQLINEKNQWIHISYRLYNRRKQVLFYDGKNYKAI